MIIAMTEAVLSLAPGALYSVSEWATKKSSSATRPLY